MNNRNTVHMVEYKWRIDHFSFYEAKGNHINSPVFCTTTESGYKWRIKLKFDETNNHDFIGLYLLADYIGKSGTIFSKYKFAVLNDQQEEIHTRQCNQIRGFKLGKERGWGFKIFITKNKLSRNETLADDKLTVYCAVIFSEKEPFEENFDQATSMQLQTLCDEYRALSENLEVLFTNQNYSDVVLSINDKKFHVHKTILAARSPVFDAMFKYKMTESEQNCLEISDMDEKVVEQMLYYIYTGKCDNIRELAEGLFVAADKYDLRGLKFRCEKVLFENLSVENATRILITADMHGAKKLKSNTIDFIVANSSEVASTETWNEMIVSHPQLLNQVFKALTRKLAT